MTMKAVLYRDNAGEFRWRLKARNGRTLADSGEGYNREKDCLAGLEQVAGNASTGAYTLTRTYDA